MVALGAVDAKSFQSLLLVQKAQTVAIPERRAARHHDAVAPDVLHHANPLAHALGRYQIGEIGGAPTEKIVGASSVEGCLQTRRKGWVGRQESGFPVTAALVFGSPLHDLVKQLTIMCHHILHVGDILQPSFYLQTAHSGIEQLLQLVASVHVSHREQITLLFENTAFGIDKVERHAANLGALATVGTAAEEMLRGIALSVVAHANAAMHKDLECHVRHLSVNVLNILQTQFAGEDHLLEAQTVEPPHLLGRAVVHLRAGMQGNGRKVHFQQCHVLHDERIDARLVELPHQLPRSLQLLVVKNCVERHINLDAKLMRLSAKRADVLD